MGKTYSKIVLGLLAVLSLASLPASARDPIRASDPSCPFYVLELSDPKIAQDGADVAPGNLKAFEDGVAGLEGGTTHPPIYNQEFGEDCWACSLAEYATALYMISNNGELRTLSPDHSLFWHIYEQIWTHASYFKNLSHKVKNREVSADEASIEAVMMLRFRIKTAAAKKTGFHVDEGNDEPTALSEAGKFGFVPDSLFNHPVATLADQKTLTAAIKSLVRDVITHASQGDLFSAPDADGVNTTLYNLAVEHLEPNLNSSEASGHKPYRPNDVFTDSDGKQWTPLTYMTKGMDFDPKAYVEVAATDENKGLLYEAINDAVVNKKIPVMMGFLVVNQKQAEKDKVWSTDLFQNGKAEVAGGHEVLIVNVRNGKVTGLVGHTFQNSWGLQGLDVNGNDTDARSRTGFNGITVDYHDILIKHGGAPQFVFPRNFLNQPKYRSLLSSVNKSSIP